VRVYVVSIKVTVEWSDLFDELGNSHDCRAIWGFLDCPRGGRRRCCRTGCFILDAPTSEGEPVENGFGFPAPSLVQMQEL